jgi:hypothetical protein
LLGVCLGWLKNDSVNSAEWARRKEMTIKFWRAEYQIRWGQGSFFNGRNYVYILIKLLQ